MAEGVDAKGKEALTRKYRAELDHMQQVRCAKYSWAAV